VICIAGLLLGFIEETIFRGLIQRRLTELIDYRLSIIVVSLLFGFMHGVWLAPLNIVFAMAVSLLLGFLYARYDDLVLITGIHASINATAFVLLPVYFA
jgi:membrane protease YdiL (CAAX protease family)